MIKALLVQTNTENTQTESNWKYKHNSIGVGRFWISGGGGKIQNIGGGGGGEANFSLAVNW